MSRNRNRLAPALALVLLLSVGGCGDDDPSGPGFGDLELDPGFVDLGDDRQTTVLLTNVSDVALGPVVLGTEPGLGINEIVNILCPQMVADVSPSLIASVAPGAQVEITIELDLAGISLQDCPEGEYDVEVTAAVGSRGLAATTLRLAFAGQG